MADLDAWQSALPTDRDALISLLAQLQSDWIRGHVDLIPAQHAGRGSEVNAHSLTLSRQIRIVEQLLLD